MGNLPTFWQLENFEERLDTWILVENPSDDLRFVVTEWVISRFDNPYADVSREPEFPNFWFGQIPGTAHQGNVVACSYWIFEGDRLVKCDQIASLRLSLG